MAAALALFAAQTPQPASAHGAPGPVTGVTATADGATKIKISWTVPASGTGGDPTGYRIDVSDDTLVWMSLVADTESTDTSYTHSGLKPNTSKYYRVFALNSAGTGPSSIDPLFDHAMTTGATVPSVVRNLQAKAVGSSKIELSWTEPADLGNAEITLYCIVAGPAETPWNGSHDTVAELGGATGTCNTPLGMTPATFTHVITDTTSVTQGGLIKVDGKKNLLHS